jgi:hypothetical protein
VLALPLYQSIFSYNPGSGVCVRITSKVNSQKQSTLPSTYDLESPPWRACMGMLYKPNPFTMYDNQAISRYVLICNVNYKPLNLLGGWVVNFLFDFLSLSFSPPANFKDSFFKLCEHRATNARNRGSHSLEFNQSTHIS